MQTRDYEPRRYHPADRELTAAERAARAVIHPQLSKRIANRAFNRPVCCRRAGIQ